MYHLFLLLSLTGISLGLPSSSRIIGGSAATPGQFPFVASLNNPYQFCGASIINDQWVLTAGHCLYQATTYSTVLVGTNYQKNGGTQYEILRTIQHEDWDPATAKNDLALIQIDGTFNFSDTVQSVEIVDAEVNATCVVAGWGYSDTDPFPNELRYVESTVISLDDCKNDVGGVDQFYLGEEQVCGLDPEGKGTCSGDAGGPLVCGGKLAGVVSYLVAGCADGLPLIFTKTSAYIDWINKHIGEE